MMPASYSQLINPQNLTIINCVCVCVLCEYRRGMEGRRKEKLREKAIMAKMLTLIKYLSEGYIWVHCVISVKFLQV